MSENTKKRAWIAWGAGVVFYLYSCFHRVAPSVMVKEIMAEFSIGAALVGTLSAVYFYTYAALQIPGGLLLDKLGTKKVLVYSALIMTLGNIIFAYSPNISFSLLGRGLVGVGAAFAWIGTLRLISLWFPADKFASLSGLGLAIGILGAVSAQLPLSKINDSIGWHNTMWFACIMGLFVLCLFIFFVPEHVSYNSEDRKTYSLKKGLATVTKNRHTWTAAFYGGLTASCLWAFSGLWAPVYLETVHGLSKQNSATAASILLIGGMIGSPFAGFISDKIKKRKLPLVISALVSSITTCTIFYVSPLSENTIFILMFITGFAAATSVLSFAIAKEHNPSWATGATVGIVNLILMSTSAIIQPLVGEILDLNWQGTIENGVRIYSKEAYIYALQLFAFAQILAFVISLFLKETNCKKHESD